MPDQSMDGDASIISSIRGFAFAPLGIVVFSNPVCHQIVIIMRVQR